MNLRTLTPLLVSLLTGAPVALAQPDAAPAQKPASTVQGATPLPGQPNLLASGVLASAAFYPERFKAAVDVVGISSLPTFLQNTQAYRQELRRVEYGDERDPEVRKVQERISPLNSVERIKAALFVQQGANDPRVPQSEAEQIVKAVRARGSDVDTITMATFLFLEKHLGTSSGRYASGGAHTPMTESV